MAEKNKPLLLEATRNKEHTHPEVQKTYNFRDYDNNFNKVINKCFRCKFFDDETDFPNRFCDKTNEGLDYHFCQGSCPLGKWQLYDPKEISILDEVSQNLDKKYKQEIVALYLNKIPSAPVKPETIEQIMKEINNDCKKKEV